MSFLTWWKPKCPVNYREKAWIETRMRWLGDQFGLNRLTRCQVLRPSEMSFPETFDQTPEAAQRLFDQLCRILDVNASQVQLAMEPHDAESHACGHCTPDAPDAIRVTDAQLENPVSLTATFACELARHNLVGRKLLDGAADRQWVADLLPVLFGLGIFAANATIRETHKCSGHSHGCSEPRQGSLPARMLGYAMAIHAWLCNDPTPNWIDDLRHDAADACSKGLAYLRSTEDSLLRPDNLHNRPPELTTRHLLAAVENGTPSEIVAALWSLAGRNREADEIVSAVAHRLHDRRPGIRAEAARTLAQLGRGGEAAVPVLLDRLSDPELEVRASAAYAVGQFHLRPELAVTELIERLDDSDTIETVAWALAQFGRSAEPAMPRLLALSRTALGRLDPAIDYLVYAVRAISPSPDEEIRELIASCDDDVQRQADGILPDEHVPIPIPPGGQHWSVWTGGAA